MVETLTQQVNEAIDNQNFEEPLLEKVRKKFEQLENEASREPDQETAYEIFKKYLEAADKAQNTSESDAVSARDIARNEAEALKRDAELSKHTSNLSKISEKIDKALYDGKLEGNFFTFGELNFVNDKKEIEDAVGAYTVVGSSLHEDAQLQEKLLDLFAKIALAKEAYKKTVKIHGHVHGDRHGKVEDFLRRMDQLAKDCDIVNIQATSELQEANDFKEKVENAKSAQELLKMYEAEPKEELLKRSTIVHALMEQHVNTSGLTLLKDAKNKGKYSFQIEEDEASEVETKRKELQAVIDKIEPNYIDAYRMNATLENIEFDNEKEVSPRSIANAIISKYEIKYEGGSAKYEDLLDDSRKDSVIEAIETKIKGAKTPEEEQDLQYLLDLGNMKEKEFMADTKLVGNFKMINSGFLEDGDLWKLLGADDDGRGNVEKIVETILTGNGGMNMLFILAASVYAMFKGKFKHVLLGAGGILALQTAEESFSGSDGQKKIMAFLSEVSPEMGKMAEGLLNKTPFGKPKFEVGFMASEFEGTYKNLYQKNVQKLEEGKLTDSMAEEDFAQIYGQLLSNDTFRNASIASIWKTMEGGASINSPWLMGESDDHIVEYKAGLLKNTEENGKLLTDRKVDEAKVRLVIKQLLENQDTEGDLIGADLFEKGAAEGLIINSDEEFNTENKEVSAAYRSISPDHPRRTKIEEMLQVTQDWSLENGMIKMGIDGKQEKQLESLIASLKQLEGNMSERHTKELGTLITALTALKERSVALEEVEKFVKDAFAGTDNRFFGAEGLLKKSADAVALGAVSSLHCFGFDKVSLWKSGSTPISNVDEKIEEGKKLLEALPESNGKNEQREKLKEAVAMLQLYKIEELKAKGGNINAAKGEYMETNSETILKELEAMEGSMEALARSNIDSLDEYYRVVMQNLGNIAVLKEYKGANMVSITPGDVVKRKADELLAHMNTLKTNITTYVKKEFPSTQGPVTSTKYDGIKARLQDADMNSIDELQRDFDLLQANLMDEGIGSSLKSGVKGVLNLFDGMNLEKVEKNKLVILSEILGDPNIANGAKQYQEDIQQLGEYIENKRESLQTNEKDQLEAEVRTLLKGFDATYTPAIRNNSGEVTTQSNVRNFIDHVGDLRDKDIGNLMSSEIQEYVDDYMESLAYSIVVNDPDINQKKKDFDELKGKIGSFVFGQDLLSPDTDAENAFEDRYKLVTEENTKKEFLERKGTDPLIAEIYKETGLTRFLATHLKIPYGTNLSIIRTDLKNESIHGILRLLSQAIKFSSAGTLQDQLMGFRDDIEKEVDTQIDGYLGRFFK